jgi:gliding motility-associated-like protein
MENQAAGLHTLTITDSRNCITDTVISIVQPGKLTVVVDPQSTVLPFCPDWQNGILTISVTGGTREYTYEWAYSADEHDSVLTNIKEDEYSLLLRDSQGCEVDTTIVLNSLNDNCLNIPSAFTPNNDVANDTWEIRYMTENGTEVTFSDVYTSGEIKVFNRNGEMVYYCKGGCPEDWTGEDNHGRLLPVDTYYYIIDLNNGDGNQTLRGIVTIIR